MCEPDDASPQVTPSPRRVLARGPRAMCLRLDFLGGDPAFQGNDLDMEWQWRQWELAYAWQLGPWICSDQSVVDGHCLRWDQQHRDVPSTAFPASCWISAE